MSDANWKEEEEASASSPIQILHSTNTLESALIFLKCMVNEHVFMNIVLLKKKIMPSLLLRFGKKMYVVGIEPHTQIEKN